MKKIIASILAAFFLVLSPISAYAATTESMMMFSSGFRSDEYAVMPLASVSDNNFNVGFAVGFYSPVSNSFDMSSTRFYSASNGLLSESVNRSYSSSFDSNDCFSFQLTFNNIDDLQNFRVLMSGFEFYLLIDDLRFFIPTDRMTMFSSYADLNWSGSIRNGNTHLGSSAQSSISVSSSSLIQSSFNVNGLSFMLDCLLDADVPDVSLWENYVESANGNAVTSASIDSFTLTFIFPLNSTFTLPSDDSIVASDYLYPGASVRAYVNFDNGICNILSDSFGDSSGLGSLSSSISSSMANMNKSINSVKTQITQSTNTITTKIDTMSQDIQTGLSNVVESAKQNTQNIINTVTQKVDEVKTGITEVKNSILDLPNKIQEMLLGLIVPDSQTMADKYSEFSQLLEEKLGVIYQIPMMLFDFFDTIVNAATTPQTTLTLPAFRLPWIDGTQLTIWNSMEYKIIPDGLEVLSDLIRTVTSMTVVVLTFNSVKRAYERFLRS